MDAAYFVSYHVIGDSFVDMFCFLDRSLPELGGDSRLTLPVMTMAGGSGTNSSTHLSSLLQQGTDTITSEVDVSLSAKVYLYSKVNANDDYGKMLLAHAKKHGYMLINCNQGLLDSTDSTMTSPVLPSTGHCIVIVSQEDRSFMTHAGCMQAFDASHVDYDSIVSDPAQHIHVHIAGYYNMEGFWDGKLSGKIAYMKRQRKLLYPNSIMCLSLVPQHDATNTWDGGLRDLLSALDIVFMNEVEATHITGGGSTATWMAYFQEHCSMTWVIITRGKEGCVAIRQGALQATQAAVPVDPVDTTGAGDAFVSGFLYGVWAWVKENAFHKNDPWKIEGIKQGLLWGCSVATCNVLIRGASVPSLPSDIRKFVARTKKA